MKGLTRAALCVTGFTLVFVSCESAKDEAQAVDDPAHNRGGASPVSSLPSDGIAASRRDHELVRSERADASIIAPSDVAGSWNADGGAVTDSSVEGQSSAPVQPAASSSNTSVATPPNAASSAPSASSPPSDSPAPPPPAPSPAPKAPGHVLFKDAETMHYLLVEAKQGAEPVDLSAKLNAISAGEDHHMAASTDGLWYADLTTRFGCQGDACLTLIAAKDMTTTTMVAPAGRRVRGPGAVAAGGKIVVYVASGTHAEDLFITRRLADDWSAPVNLSAGLATEHNALPRFSVDGTRVVFSCGGTWYQSGSTDLCEVKLDGGPARVIVRDADGPTGGTSGRLRSPDYAPDGSVVFEGQWSAEQIWQFSTSSGKPLAVSPTYTNDNSPCVLPDGRIASLWLGRPGNSAGLHELKIMNADGTGAEVIYRGRDVVDTGLSCMP